MTAGRASAPRTTVRPREGMKNALVVSAGFVYRSSPEVRSLRRSSILTHMANMAQTHRRSRSSRSFRGAGLEGERRSIARLLMLLLTIGGLIWMQAPQTPAAEPVGEISPQSDSEVVYTGAATGEGVSQKGPSLFPFLISFGVHGGYDSNARTSPDPMGSWFSSQELTLSYERAREATNLAILARGGVVERFSANTDANGSLDLSLDHQVSDRLTLTAGITAAYRAEPTFATDLGLSRRAGNYFSTADLFSVAYKWTQRFSTVSSFSFRLLRYDDNLTAAFSDRQDYTLGEEFRFAAARHTALVANYRFLVVDYVTLPQDSITNFFLAGVEQTFSSRLQAQLRGGVSFRSIEGGQEQTNPDVEGSMNYALGPHSTIVWTGRYGVEAQSTGLRESTSNQPTFRTGLQFRYAITPRISSALGFNYHKNQNQSRIITTPDATFVAANAYDVLLNFRYQINRHVDCDLSYQRSGASSSDPLLEYSRNRYSIGLNFTF
jgi:hypothetical protein